MSNFSTLYDNMKTNIGTVLSAHTWLSEAQVIGENNEQSLRKGYAIQIGSGVQGDLHIGCDVSIVREITITITREHFALELNRDQKYTVEQALLDDQLLVIKEIEKDPAQSYGISAQVANLKFLGDSGIERIFEDKKNFLMIRSVFSLTYLESLT